MKKTAKIVTLLLVVCLALTFVLVACNDDETPKVEENALAASLKTAINNYVESKDFKFSVANADSAQSRVPLLYVRYLKNFVRNDLEVEESKLALIDEIIDKNGAISDDLYEGSKLYLDMSSEWGSYKLGWKSIVDYLYSWSTFYNDYLQYCAATNADSTRYDKYLEQIKAYLTQKDTDDTYCEIAFGYDRYSMLTLTAYNLGFDVQEVVPKSASKLLDYYQKNDDGSFAKVGASPNWVGFTGRPLAVSAIKSCDNYDINYEKSMQPLFPYEEDFSSFIDISKYATMDTLYDDFGHQLDSQYGSTVDTRYGILYGYINGIDMSAYVKSTDDSTKYDIIGKWIATLTVDENGNYVLADSVDLAIAIAYVAYSQGVAAPTPVGVFTTSVPCIEL